MRDEPEKQRNNDADNQAGDDWEVERSVFAAVNDVARQLSQAKWKFVPPIKESTNQGEEPSEEDKRAAEFAQRVHLRQFYSIQQRSLRNHLAITIIYLLLTRNAKCVIRYCVVNISAADSRVFRLASKGTLNSSREQDALQERIVR